jgi:CRP-like cAMP-binding protein
VPARKNRELDPGTFLATIEEGRKSLSVSRKPGIFTQGDAADAVFYIQKGKVRLSVVSKTGKEATIGIRATGIFSGKAHWPGRLRAWDRRCR